VHICSFFFLRLSSLVVVWVAVRRSGLVRSSPYLPSLLTTSHCCFASLIIGMGFVLH
ncbi:hypothetical protein EV122DRAFT_262882, partial [Schizophyllum commune]